MHAMARKPPLMRSLLLGLRVINRLDGRSGFVIGKPEVIGTRFSLVPVVIEGSTRNELWPEHWIDVRPTKEQFPALGGRFKAAPGFPLRIR
jgi:hypothetical protein